MVMTTVEIVGSVLPLVVTTTWEKLRAAVWAAALLAEASLFIDSDSLIMPEIW